MTRAAPGTRLIYASLLFTVAAMLLALVVVVHFFFAGGGAAGAGRRLAYGIAAEAHGSLSVIAALVAIVGTLKARRADSPPTARFGVVVTLLGAFGLLITAVLAAISTMAGPAP